MGGVRPASSASILSTTILAISSRTSTRGAAEMRIEHDIFHLLQLRVHFRLDARTRRARRRQSSCLFSARTSAASSMIGPRAVLMMKAVFFIRPSSRAPIWWRVCGVERRMQRDEIGFAQQLVERHEGQAGLALFAFRLAARRPIKHAHGEALARARATALPISPPPPIRPDRLAVHDGAEQMARLPAGEFSGAHQPVAFHHAARDREHQPERQVGGRLGGHRRHHGDRDAALGRFGDVDIGRRDRLRRDVAQLRVGRDHGAIDLVVQQAKQDIGLA